MFRKRRAEDAFIHPDAEKRSSRKLGGAEGIKEPGLLETPALLHKAIYS
jgi:hypothetical protein